MDEVEPIKGQLTVDECIEIATTDGYGKPRMLSCQTCGRELTLTQVFQSRSKRCDCGGKLDVVRR